MNRISVALFLALVAGCNGSEPSSSATSGAASTTNAATIAPSAVTATSAVALPVREGGVIARAVEDDALFIADEDHEVVRALALPAEVKSARVDFRCPGRPAQLLPTRDRILVTIRQVGSGEGALLVLRRKGALDLEEAGRVPLPADAWGVALTPDGDTALVTSAWTHRLTAVDLRKLEVQWSVDVAREPRGVVVLPGDRAYVSHLVGSDVTRVDGIGTKQPSVKRVELPASPLRSPAGVKLTASLGYSLVASPEGDRLYLPRHALGAMGADSWFGAGSVDVMLTANDTGAAPPRSAAPTAHFVESIDARIAKHEIWGLDGVGPVVESNGRINSPRAVAFRKKTRTLLVVNEGSDGIAELDARPMDPTLVVVRGYGTARNIDQVLGIAEHGEAPSGIALSKDEDMAYVFCRATDDVIVLDLPPDAHGYRTVPHAAVSLGGIDQDKDLRMGRALFYDGLNGTLSGGVACAGCHPEGRDDGFVWREAKITLRTPETSGQPVREDKFTNFFASADVSAIKARWGDISAEGGGGFGYARQTPMIAGRVKAQGPYGWHGESPDLPSRIIAGFGLHRWNESGVNKTMQTAYTGFLVKFLREGLVPPPRVDRPLTEEEERGKAVFTNPATKCATCHPPQTDYTDRSVVSLKKIAPTKGFADDPSALYKVPSLLGVGGTAPYMHDGRFESLESLIEYNQDRMGATSQLSPEDRKALIAYLRTL